MLLVNDVEWPLTQQEPAGGAIAVLTCATRLTHLRVHIPVKKQKFDKNTGPSTGVRPEDRGRGVLQTHTAYEMGPNGRPDNRYFDSLACIAATRHNVCVLRGKSSKYGRHTE